MPRRKQKFIDKKSSVTFHLVHRSQQDPLQASEESSKHVLVEQQDSTTARKEEQRKFGVFYEDEYDYLQHLKDTNEIYEVELVDRVYVQPEQIPKILLPKGAFASDFEKPVGLLNEAVPVRGPQPDWDPDIVEALDDDFDFDDPDNQLDDDFILKANNDGETPKEGDEDDGSDLETVSDIDSNEANLSDENDDFDEDFEYGDNQFMDEETKSKFTNYSMSSSVIRRNKGLTLLDDRFEKLYQEYDDTEIGALDQEEIDGSIQQGSQVLNKLLDEFEEQQQQSSVKLSTMMEGKQEDDDMLISSDEDSETELVEVDATPQERWDCETVLTTYSNIYNHPKLITEARKPKSRKNSSMSEKPNSEGVEEDVLLGGRTDRAITYRPRGETAQERAERKKAVKEERKERREEKKNMKKLFTKEKIRQDKEIINVNKNLKAVKIV